MSVMFRGARQSSLKKNNANRRQALKTFKAFKGVCHSLGAASIKWKRKYTYMFLVMGSKKINSKIISIHIYKKWVHL